MRRKVVGLGELLWDVLPGGRQLGGAPANFDYHAGALGAEAHVISRVGRDADGRELVARLEQLGIGTACIEEDSAAPTSTVTVSLGGDGQPCYTIHENVAWDALAGEAAARRAVATADAIYFGTLAQRSETSRRTIRTLLGFVPPTALRISWQSAPRGGRLVRARRAADNRRGHGGRGRCVYRRTRPRPTRGVAARHGQCTRDCPRCLCVLPTRRDAAAAGAFVRAISASVARGDFTA